MLILNAVLGPGLQSNCQLYESFFFFNRFPHGVLPLSVMEKVSAVKAKETANVSEHVTMPFIKIDPNVSKISQIRYKLPGISLHHFHSHRGQTPASLN